MSTGFIHLLVDQVFGGTATQTHTNDFHSQVFFYILLSLSLSIPDFRPLCDRTAVACTCLLSELHNNSPIVTFFFPPALSGKGKSTAEAHSQNIFNNEELQLNSESWHLQKFSGGSAGLHTVWQLLSLTCCLVPLVCVYTSCVFAAWLLLPALSLHKANVGY